MAIVYFLIVWRKDILVHLDRYATEYSYMKWLHMHKSEYDNFKVIKGSEISVTLLNHPCPII